VLLPYTNRSRENLLREGIGADCVYVTGNPIKQVIDYYADRIAVSSVLQDFSVEERRYFLVTVHRAENVDREDKLRDLVQSLADLANEYALPVILSLHPRTRSRMERFGVDLDHARVHFVPPMGFFDFVRLEQSAFCLLSDSGTVQEETCLFGVPNVTLREVTERPETLECGSNLLAGSSPRDVLAAVGFVTSHSHKWIAPPEYLAPAVAETVCRIVTGYRESDSAEREWVEGSRT
jgi:UDP-N-acetylglucosamine 2-epimerase (non-hydrolysing)